MSPPKAHYPWPKRLKIRGRDWKVSYVTELKDDDGDPALGLTRKNKLSIELSLDQAPQAMVITLLHEIRHALQDAQGFAVFNEGLEEALAEDFAGCVFDLYKNNDIRWIMNR